MKHGLVVIGPVPPPYHGCSVVTEEVLRSRLRDGFDVIHLDTTDRRSLDNLGRWGLRNITLALGTIGRALRLAVSRRPAVVYLPVSQNSAGFLRDGILMLVFSVVARSAVVVHLHGSSFRRFRSIAPAPMRWFTDIAMRTAKHGIVLGEALRPEFDRWLPPDRISVLPNGTHLQPPVTAGTRSTGADGLRVLFLGNLLKFKGVTVAIQAACRVLESHPETRFMFAGRWTHDPAYNLSAEQIQRECRGLVAGSPAPGAFEFLGEVSQDRVQEILGSSDVLMLPSEAEGLPLVILEAMAARNAVIASSGVGAIPEVVEDGVTGILVRPRDPDGLARALSRLAEDRDLLRGMQRAGRDRCERLYSMDRWISGLVDIMNDACRSRTVVVAAAQTQG